MSSRFCNAWLICALAAAAWPAIGGVTRGVGAPTVVALANAYAISGPIVAPEGTAAPYAVGPRLFALPLRVSGRTFPSMPGEFGAYDPPIRAPLQNWSPDGSGVACTASAISHAGAIVVIERGSCSFSTKIRNAQAAGAIGVVIVDNEPGGPLVMSQDGTAHQPTLPAVMISQSDGTAMKRCAGLVATLDGSAPAAFPAPAEAARSDDLHNPMNIGRGVLTFAAATNPTATLEPASISFRKGEPVAKEIPVTLTNPTGAIRTYVASIVLSGLAGGEVAGASVTISPSSMTLAPGESAAFSVTVRAPDGAAGPWWGRLTLTPDAGSELAAPFWFAGRTYTDAGPLH